MSDKDVLAQQLQNEQVKREIDQRAVDNEANAQPEELRIDPAKLFTQATEQTRMALCFSDPKQDDCPLVYVNEAFTRLTGYEREEAVGRNCRFLQGEDTDPAARKKLAEALAAQDVVVIDILNYRKDGTPFWNALHVGPIFDEDGELEYFYGSQWDVTEIFGAREEALRQEVVAEELQHRTNNLFAILSSIVSITARAETDAQVLSEKIQERIGALGRAHSASIAPGGRVGSSTDLRHLVEAVMKPYRTGSEGRVSMAGDLVELPKEVVTPVGLALHELATNAVKYGSLSVRAGTVCIDWARNNGKLVICWVENDGPPPENAGSKGAGTGSRLMQGILAGQGGRIESDAGSDGYRATIYLPIDS